MPTGSGPIDKPRRRRLPRDRFASLPLATRIRVVDEAVLEAARNRGRCERCGRPQSRLDPHHISSRGARGGDVPGNVIALCRACHDTAHRGLVSRAELRAIVAARPRPPPCDASTSCSPPPR